MEVFCKLFRCDPHLLFYLFELRQLIAFAIFCTNWDQFVSKSLCSMSCTFTSCHSHLSCYKLLVVPPITSQAHFLLSMSSARCYWRVKRAVENSETCRRALYPGSCSTSDNLRACSKRYFHECSTEIIIPNRTNVPAARRLDIFDTGNINSRLFRLIAFEWPAVQLLKVFVMFGKWSRTGNSRIRRYVYFRFAPFTCSTCVHCVSNIFIRKKRFSTSLLFCTIIFFLQHLCRQFFCCSVSICVQPQSS